MKTTRLNQIARLAMVATLFAAAGGVARADELVLPQPSHGQCQGQCLVPKVINIPGSNNQLQSVTVWVPQETAQPVAATTTTAEQNLVPKVINIPGSNNQLQSVTVWVPN